MPVVHKAQERIYLTADRKTAVGEGDSRAAFLYAAPGDEIPEGAAEVLGIEAGKVKVKLAAKETKSPAAPAAVNAGREVKAKGPAKGETKSAARAKQMKTPAEDKEDKAGEDKGSDEKGTEDKGAGTKGSDDTSGDPDGAKPSDGAGG